MAIRCLYCMKEHEEGISKCPHCGFVEGANEDEMCYLPPRTVLKGRYMIGCCLGSGGFGITYVAWDSLLEKKVAIKEYMPSELATRTMGETRVTVHDNDCVEKYQKGRTSFLEESRRLAKFNNCKGIVSIFDCFDENDTAYLVMECLEGKTLQQIINERKKIPFKEALPIFIDVLDALSVVHDAGMMHRDIAPDNIFVCNDGTAKLIDFGAARFMTTSHSRSLSMILKIGYAPIEQYTKHGNQGPWTDIYAVAASLYHAITGIVPPDSYDRVEEDKLKNPSLHAKHLPKHAETAILNALNIIETNRTQSAAQFAEELKGDIDVARIREKIKHEDTGRIAKWMKYAAAGVALAIVAFGALFVATGENLFRSDDYDVPDGMSRVPYIIDTLVSDADVKLENNSLHMVIGDRVTDTYFDNNYVLQQNPRSGNVAYTGSVVSVTASMKPDEYYVSDLSDYTREAAVKMLEAAGFTVKLEEDTDDTVAPGAVIRQSPLGNTIVFEGSEVTLVINSGSKNNKFDYGKSVSIKNYIGMQFEKAQNDASGKKLYMAISGGKYSDDIPAGEIIEQSPEKGGTIYEGGTVYVTVSLGKKTIIVPNVTYLSEEDALTKLNDRLLTPTIKYVESDTVQEGLVFAQLPLSGKSIYENGEVTIYVSDGFKTVVPNVVGLKQQEAQSLLAESVLGYAVTQESSTTVPKGTVISQSLKAGESTAQGTIVTIVVSSGNDVVNVTGVSLNTSNKTLEYGEVYTFVATVSPKKATTTSVTWSSSNSSVVSVNSAGVVTANGVGTAIITVKTKDGGYTAQCTVTVVKLLESLTVTSAPDTKSYYLGDSANYSGLVLTAKYSDGSTENVTKSANTSTSGFDSSSSGDKTIICQYTYDGTTKSTSFSVHIRALKAIEITKPEKTTYELNDSLSLTGFKVVAKYDDGTTRDVTSKVKTSGFSSSKSGSYTVTVTYTEGTTMTGSFNVTIKGNLVITDPDASSIEMDNDASRTLTAAYKNGETEYLSTITWESSNPSVVSVSGNGSQCTVKALSAGTATIVAKDKNGATARITANAYGPWQTGYNMTSYNYDVYDYDEENTWTEYRYKTRMRSTTTTTNSSSSLSGWTLYNNTWAWSDYGAWSGWQDSVIYSSDAREVRTQTVNDQAVYKTVYGTKTVYNYYRWAKDSTSKGNSVKNNSCPNKETYQFDVMLTLQSGGGYTAYTGTNGVKGYMYWKGTSNPNVVSGNYITVWKDDPFTSTVTDYSNSWQEIDYYTQKNQYSYRDRYQIYTYYFYKWNDWGGYGDWSDWSKTAKTAGSSVSGSVPNQTETQTEVETRTGCRYRLKP